MKTTTKAEFGDFQTPQGLAKEVCALLMREGVKADTIIEPTCGTGAFLLAAANAYPAARLFGWDINPAYVSQAQELLAANEQASRIAVSAQDFFAFDWSSTLSGMPGQLLVLGNLPWVTNSTISVLRSGNVPKKENLHGLRGLDALTGKSNFDIAEWMLIQLLKALRGRPATIAVLCKTSTARKTLRYGWLNDGRIASAAIRRIDAQRVFAAAVDACLLLIHMGLPGERHAAVFANLTDQEPENVLGWEGKDLVADVQAYRQLRHFEGLCPYQWRSGVKHDCASVVELTSVAGNQFENKRGERVSLEEEYLFPLLKCSDLAHGRTSSQRRLLLSQRRMGEDTTGIQVNAPRTWAYLKSHEDQFLARKSSIYARGKIPFAIFGVGEYTFAPWKVAVSSMHKTIRFILLDRQHDKPMMLDDTCYFLPFYNQQEAEVVCSLLNSSSCRRFLSALIFPDSKRPVTIDILQRLNFQRLMVVAGLEEAWATARSSESSFSPLMNVRQPELAI